MDKVDAAIMRLREAAQMSEQIYGKSLIVTDSGGKDSSICVYLAQKAGIPFEVQHSHTTVDAPETVYFVRNKFKAMERDGVKCSISYPIYKKKRTSMWELIADIGAPNRWERFCCKILKEQAGKGRFVVTGVRWDESRSRRTSGIYETKQKDRTRQIILNNDNDEKRQLFETCQLKAKRVCNPIVDWTDRDVWDFIQSDKIEINPLYREGWHRVGCVGCPLISKNRRSREFARWPKYKALYLLAFDKYIKNKKARGGVPIGDTAEEIFHWWMEDGVLPGQTNLFTEE